MVGFIRRYIVLRRRLRIFMPTTMVAIPDAIMTNVEASGQSAAGVLPVHQPPNKSIGKLASSRALSAPKNVSI
jgi:hypothetical protein